MIWINGIDFFGWVPLPAIWDFGSLRTRDVSWRVKPEAIDRTTATTSTWTKMRSDMPQVYFILHSWPQFDDSLQVLQVWLLFHVVSMYPKFRYRKDMIDIETWKYTYAKHTQTYGIHMLYSYTSYKQQAYLCSLCQRRQVDGAEVGAAWCGAATECRNRPTDRGDRSAQSGCDLVC